MASSNRDKPIINLEDEIDELIDDVVKSSVKTDNDIETFYTKEAFRVIYQTNNFFLPQIKGLIDGKEIINIRPEYQRRLRWTTKQKSLLIESLLLNIPIPPIFLYEGELARYEVMDGQQRLNAVREFLNNDFRLTGLSQLSPLNGRTFSKCPPKIQKGLERSSLSAIVLLFESEDHRRDQLFIRRYVFERLNTGGQKLNPQEIRNALFAGPFNELIVKLARNHIFTDIWGIPQYTETDQNDYYENPERQKNTLYRTMGDCQIVLRYFALREPQHIRGSMRSILDTCMARNKHIRDATITEYSSRFSEIIKLAYDVFDTKPFCIPIPTSPSRMSLGLYDSVMVALDRVWELRPTVLKNKAQIQARLAKALADPRTYAKIVGRANTASAITERIKILEDIFRASI